MRRRRNLGEIPLSPSPVISQGVTGVLGTMGLAFPGLGLLIGLAISKLGIFQDKPDAATLQYYALLKQIAERVKARDFAGARSLFDFGTFRMSTVDNGPGGVENMMFAAVMGHAVENGARAQALAFASDIDRAQSAWETWRDRELERIRAAESEWQYQDAGGMEARDVYMTMDHDEGQLIPVYDTDEGQRRFKPDSGDGGD